MLAVLLAGLAAAVLVAAPGGGAQRLAAVSPRPAPRARTVGPAAACAVGGLGVALLVGLPVGLLPGLLLAVGGPRVVARLEPAAVRNERSRLALDLPLVLDLLAACLAGGATAAAAAAAVGAAVPGPCGQRLIGVAAALTVGTDPADAWLGLSGAREDDPMAPAGRVLARAARGGAPVAATVARLAAEARAEARGTDEQAARRLGVLVVAPLGLCFLPAFVLLGIVPVVLGLARPLLAGF